MSINGNTKSLHVVIVGGGQAGIVTSYFLQSRQISHIVLEWERAFAEWYGRWDNFHMNTANWMHTLPGAESEFAPGASRDALGTRANAIHYLRDYLLAVNPPIMERGQVTHVQHGENGTWRVVTPQEDFETGNVVICTGS